MTRQDQTAPEGRRGPGGGPGRFLQVEMFTSPPMTAEPQRAEGRVRPGPVYSSEAGKREATIGFDVGQGTQDLGFRGEVPVLFDVRPAVPVTLRDPRPRRHADRRAASPSPTARATSIRRSPSGSPPTSSSRSRSTAPTAASSCCRRARSTMTYGRGPEYRLEQPASSTVPDRGEATLDVRLERWIDPAAYGFFGGDHHIHAAGCAHYTEPDARASCPRTCSSRSRARG